MDVDRVWVGAQDRTPEEFARLRAEVAREAAVDLSALRSFCLFVGYPRSGHSLVGALLDAHRHTLLAHELDVLAFVGEGFSKDELARLVLGNARRFAAAGRAWTDYAYDVAGQWQGRCAELRILGDKKGGRSVRRLGDDPSLADRLAATMGVPLRYVHVVRNPWDNVATRIRRKPATDAALLADRHFALVERVAALRERVGERALLDVRHEHLVADPRATLARLAAFLGLDAPEDWLAACASVVRPAPRRSRDEITWPRGLVDSIAARAARHAFLAGYAFDD